MTPPRGFVPDRTTILSIRCPRRRANRARRMRQGAGMASDDVLFEQDGPIATITLNRPDKMNALTAEMMYRLRDIWAQVREDERIWVAILTGAGDRAFSAGRDLMAAAP